MKLCISAAGTLNFRESYWIDNTPMWWFSLKISIILV